MPRHEVLLVIDESIHYYIEADNPEQAELIAHQMFIDGEPDQNPGAGWSKITSTHVKEIPPCPAL